MLFCTVGVLDVVDGLPATAAVDKVPPGADCSKQTHMPAPLDTHMLSHWLKIYPLVAATSMCLLCSPQLCIMQALSRRRQPWRSPQMASLCRLLEGEASNRCHTAQLFKTHLPAAVCRGGIWVGVDFQGPAPALEALPVSVGVQYYCF